MVNLQGTKPNSEKNESLKKVQNNKNVNIAFSFWLSLFMDDSENASSLCQDIQNSWNDCKEYTAVYLPNFIGIRLKNTLMKTHKYCLKFCICFLLESIWNHFDKYLKCLQDVKVFQIYTHYLCNCIPKCFYIYGSFKTKTCWNMIL